MDGIQKRMNESLQIRLSLWLSLAIMVVGLIAGIVAFFSAFNEAHELQDDVLREVATLFDRHNSPVLLVGDASEKADSDPESRVFVQLLSAPPSRTTGRNAKHGLALPRNIPDGMQTVGIGGVTYRVLVTTLGNGQRLAVAQETAVRDEIARNGSLRTLMPLVILVPVLLLVVAHLVRKIFRTVADLSVCIDKRGEQELHPIDLEPLPTEIRPFVEAINRLLGRVRQSMDAQQRLIADAAHELRSPLTALSLQAERLASAEMSANAHERLETLRRGIERGRTLLNQLLSLARAQSSAKLPMGAVSVMQVYRRVLEDLLPLAENKGIDIGVISKLDAQVLVDEIDLVTIVKNLVDNAIRYTPAGGRVDLSVSASDRATAVVVEDSGPGISEPERERVFEPFYRVLGSEQIGSGLGLSIVRAIAARVGAKVSLEVATQAGSGLRVIVTFPSPKK